jgi:hypothetical protein
MPQGFGDEHPITPLGNRRRLTRFEPSVETDVLVELARGKTARARILDESPSGGARLLFEEDPRVSVGKTIAVWYRRTPTPAEVRNINEGPEGFRVGVHWCR